MSEGLTFTIEVIEKDLASKILGIEAREFNAFLSDDAAADFAAGRTNIPQMPHIPGRPVKFHLPTLREWRLRYFQKGGEPLKSRKQQTAAPA